MREVRRQSQSIGHGRKRIQKFSGRINRRAGIISINPLVPVIFVENHFHLDRNGKDASAQQNVARKTMIEAKRELRHIEHGIKRTQNVSVSTGKRTENLGVSIIRYTPQKTEKRFSSINQNGAKRIGSYPMQSLFGTGRRKRERKVHIPRKSLFSSAKNKAANARTAGKNVN